MGGRIIKTLAIAAAIAAIILLSGHGAKAEVCNGDLVKLGETCRKFCLIPGPRQDPSPECCRVIQHSDLPCVCSNYPKGTGKTVSAEKVAYIWKFCGRPVNGMKCGDCTFPPAAAN